MRAPPDGVIDAPGDEQGRADASRLPLVIASVAVAISLSGLVASVVVFGRDFELIDLAVYRMGGGLAFNGSGLYQAVSGQFALLFTYPPFAALVFRPLTWVPWTAVEYLWTTASLAGLLVLSASARITSPLRGRLPIVLGVFAVGLLMEPVQSTLSFGQVNLILTGFIVADLSGLLHRIPQGFFVGLAGAIKLTPMFFLLYLWITGRRRAAVTGLVTFAGAAALAWVLMPTESREYWGQSLRDTRRVGDVAYVADQSIHGVLERLLGPGATGAVTALWVVLAMGTGAFGLLVARRAFQRWGEPAGMFLAALTSLLVAPISWTHHYVWIAVLLAYLVERRGDFRRRLLLGGGLCVLVFFLQPPWWLPYGHDVEYDYSPLQQVVAASYVIAGVVILLGARSWLARDVPEPPTAAVGAAIPPDQLGR